ncbi:MAG: hypothetical protein ACOX66_00530 [Oscillospiraceae bacterium]|jgi:hypothetical protein
MAKTASSAKPISLLLIAALLLLNFAVVSLRVSVPSTSGGARPASDGAPVSTLSYLMHDLHDSQDPETTACRYAFRQVIRSGDPPPALLTLSGILPVASVVCALSCGGQAPDRYVPRMAERIAAFLHDLAAAL